MTAQALMKLPPHLSSHHASGIEPQECIAQFEIGDMQNFVYLILDWKSKAAAIVDPQKNLQPLEHALEQHGFHLVATLLTHTHFDHVAGVPAIAQRYPHLPIYLHEHDSHRLTRANPQLPLNFLTDGQTLNIGVQQIQALHTPGHSAGELCYLINSSRPYLLTGDTVFIRDCGRTDLPTGSNQELFASLQKIKTLPLETVILPGHHYAPECASTLEEQLRTSPPFLCKTIEELVALP